MKRTLIALMVLVMALPSYAFLDFDYDGIDDQWEWSWFRDFTTANDTSDYDGDGLTDYQEFMIGTYPITSDTDRDGMPDRWEVVYGYSPTNTADGAIDTDHDGVVNSNEYYIGSHPSLIDTDHDGLTDSNEFYNTFQIYTLKFSGIIITNEYREWTNRIWTLTNVTIPATSPTSKDGDGDGVNDFDEVFVGTNPNDPNDYFATSATVTNGLAITELWTIITNGIFLFPHVDLFTNAAPVLTITWKPAYDRGYHMMMTTNILDDNSWTNITLQPFYGNNLTIGNGLGPEYVQEFVATNMNQLCSWSQPLANDRCHRPLTNDIPNAYYKVKVSSWYDRYSKP